MPDASSSSSHVHPGNNHSILHLNILPTHSTQPHELAPPSHNGTLCTPAKMKDNCAWPKLTTANFGDSSLGHKDACQLNLMRFNNATIVGPVSASPNQSEP
eukprot:scaffold117914_cov36-Tisochrysis_lutea.AAC.1